jgi:hypothetical protein
MRPKRTCMAVVLAAVWPLTAGPGCRGRVESRLAIRLPTPPKEQCMDEKEYARFREKIMALPEEQRAEELAMYVAREWLHDAAARLYRAGGH